MNRSQHQLAKAFTKVELVVVALVLGAAAYLLTPVLNGRTIARDRARCLANLGQIGTAMSQYLIESGNHWPYISKLDSLRTGSPPWPTLPQLLAKYTSVPLAEVPEKEFRKKSSSDHYRDHSQEVFHCPADHRVLGDDSSLRKKFPAKTTYFETEGTSYEWWFGEAYGGKKIGEESLGKSTGFGLGRADQPLLSDFEPFHKGDEQGAINTLNADLKPRTTRAKPKA